MAKSGTAMSVPENLGRLRIVEHDGGGFDVDVVAESLRQDSVIIIRDLRPEQADNCVYEVARSFGLTDALRLQAGFAGFLGHRYSIGKHFMSVNSRNEYQFITPHSEGRSSTGMQLACFFCSENSTNGGDSILMNVNDSSTAWQSLRESVTKGKLGSRRLAKHEIVRARMLYRVHLPADVLRDDDQILHERRTEIADLTIAEVLAKPRRTYSCVLNREVYAYSDSVASIDFDCAGEYARLLRQCGLLREPDGGLELSQMDAAANRRVWHSGVDFSHLFNCKITCRLAPGELLICNNMTWAHSASNWSPGYGRREGVGCFRLGATLWRK